MLQRRTFFTALLLSSALALTLGACSGGEDEAPARRGPMAFPVEVMTIGAEQVEYQVAAVGSLEAYEEVSVTARVSGAVDHVRFMEGDYVEAGAVLAEIEPERFRVNVRSARASYERAQAARQDAEAALRRRVELSERTPGLVREEELQTFRTQAQVAASEAAQAKAALDLAELNQRDAIVRAPFSGIVQSRDVRTGQYLQPGGVIATLVREEPLLLRFQVPEGEAARLEVGMDTHFRLSGGSRDFAADIIHVAASAHPESRMVPITARVQRAEGEATGTRGDGLRPGAFAQVRIPVEVRDSAIVIPQLAVRPSERGFLAYIVEEDKAAERIVRLGMRTPDGRVEILEGLEAGNQLVVRGTEALRAGATVKVTERVDAREARAIGDSPEPARTVDEGDLAP